MHPRGLAAASNLQPAALLADGLSGLSITETVRAVVEAYEWPGAVSLEAVEDAERWARAHADALVDAR